MRDHDILSAPGDQFVHTGQQLLFTGDFTFEGDRQFMLVEFYEQGPFRKYMKERRFVGVNDNRNSTLLRCADKGQIEGLFNKGGQGAADDQRRGVNDMLQIIAHKTLESGCARIRGLFDEFGDGIVPLIQ